MSQDITYFFSYARKDSDFVLRLANDLREKGVLLWLDQLDILGGQRWDRAVQEALDACAGMVVVLSPDSSNSDNVLDEVACALDENKLIIPILLRPTTIPLRLRRIHYIDFTSAYDTAFPQLLRALGIKPAVVKEDFTQAQETRPRIQEPSRAIEIPTTPDGKGGRALPFAIGIETLGGIFSKLIPEGSSLPQRYTEIFSTASDNQTSVEVKVLAGLRPLAKDNILLTTFSLDGILPAARGVPQIEVVIEIDIQGVFNVSAKDLATGKRQNINFQSSFSKQDLEQMMRESQLHSTDDARTLQEIEARNRATQNQGFAQILSDLFGTPAPGDQTKKKSRR